MLYFHKDSQYNCFIRLTYKQITERRWTMNEFRSYTIHLTDCEKLINCQWKHGSVWCLTRPMRHDERPETYSFQDFRNKIAVWVLTREINEYDQYGEYFVACFSEKPSKQLLLKAEVPESHLDHLLNNGGGRIGIEDEWYFLREVSCNNNDPDYGVVTIQEHRNTLPTTIIKG